VSDTAAAGSDIDGSTIAAARAGEPDRYLAALLAPPPQREALLALAAFAAEIARVPLLAVREPAMGDIRLQWWRDALEFPQALRTGHAVADAVRAAAHSYHLPAALLGGLIDGHAAGLRRDPPIDEAQLRDLLWQTEGAQFALAARVLGLADDPALGAACRASGHACGLTRLLWDLPRTLSLGRLPLAGTQVVAAGLTAEEVLAGTGGPKVAMLLGACIAQIRDSLATARHFAGRLPRTERVAFLPLALVEPYLRALERPGRAPLREEAHLAPLVRVCRIAMAHLFGRP
jgi:15-cis-phytoene synthase